MPRKPKPAPGRGGRPGRHARHGAGSVYPIRNGRWAGAARVTLPDGKRIRIYVYGETEDEAAALLDRRRVELLHDPAGTTRASTPLAAYLTHWLDTVVKLRCRDSTYRSYATHLRTITLTLGRTTLADLTPAMIQSRYATLLRDGRTPSYLHKVHTMLKGALQQAVEWELISRNPARALTLPRQPRREYTTLAPAELRQVLGTAVASRHRLTVYWLLLATTGLRRGEALGVRWQDLDLERGVLTVLGQLVRIEGGRMEWTETKTGRGRSIQLMPPVVAALRIHRQAQDRARRPSWPRHPFVFLNDLGEPWGSGAINRAWGRLLVQAGVPPVRLHDLRHGVATMLLLQGVDAKITQELLGHSSIRTTLDVYSHVSPGRHREAMQTLEGLILPATGALAGHLAGRAPEEEAS